jgi:protein-S-isoprenylcysteine O-methyltransferase Ste14
MEREVYSYLLWAWAGVAACVFIALQFLTAPYGRHARPGWGPTIHRTAGWVIMESPAVLVFLACFLASDRRTDPVAITFLLLWLLHYAWRAFIYPFRLRAGQLRMPVSVMAMAVIFNVMNGYLQGRGLFTLGPARGVEWFTDPRFIVGVLLFLGGYALNQQSDIILRGLRAPGDTGYRIPYGGAFGLVSCPNYFGELVEWLGWAILTWSPAGLVFFLWTAANLVPRARSHHRWYQERFSDYPAGRKAVVPFLY